MISVTDSYFLSQNQWDYIKEATQEDLPAEY